MLLKSLKQNTINLVIVSLITQLFLSSILNVDAGVIKDIETLKKSDSEQHLKFITDNENDDNSQSKSSIELKNEKKNQEDISNSKQSDKIEENSEQDDQDNQEEKEEEAVKIVSVKHKNEDSKETSKDSDEIKFLKKSTPKSSTMLTSTSVTAAEVPQLTEFSTKRKFISLESSENLATRNDNEYEVYTEPKKSMNNKEHKLKDDGDGDGDGDFSKKSKESSSEEAINKNIVQNNNTLSENVNNYFTNNNNETDKHNVRIITHSSPVTTSPNISVDVSKSNSEIITTISPIVPLKTTEKMLVNLEKTTTIDQLKSVVTENKYILPESTTTTTTTKTTTSATNSKMHINSVPLIKEINAEKLTPTSMTLSSKEMNVNGSNKLPTQVIEQELQQQQQQQQTLQLQTKQQKPAQTSTDESNEIHLIGGVKPTTEKRGKFINSTNLQQLHFPKGAETSSSALMKLISNNLTPTTTTEQTIPNDIKNGLNEKNLLDWTQIMLNGELNGKKHENLQQQHQQHLQQKEEFTTVSAFRTTQLPIEFVNEIITEPTNKLKTRNKNEGLELQELNVEKANYETFKNSVINVDKQQKQQQQHEKQQEKQPVEILSIDNKNDKNIIFVTTATTMSTITNETYNSPVTVKENLEKQKIENFVAKIETPTTPTTSTTTTTKTIEALTTFAEQLFIDNKNSKNNNNLIAALTNSTIGNPTKATNTIEIETHQSTTALPKHYLSNKNKTKNDADINVNVNANVNDEQKPKETLDNFAAYNSDVTLNNNFKRNNSTVVASVAANSSNNYELLEQEQSKLSISATTIRNGQQNLTHEGIFEVHENLNKDVAIEITTTTTTTPSLTSTTLLESTNSATPETITTIKTNNNNNNNYKQNLIITTEKIVTTETSQFGIITNDLEFTTKKPVEIVNEKEEEELPILITTIATNKLYTTPLITSNIESERAKTTTTAEQPTQSTQISSTDDVQLLITTSEKTTNIINPLMSTKVKTATTTTTTTTETTTEVTPIYEIKLNSILTPSTTPTTPTTIIKNNDDSNRLNTTDTTDITTTITIDISREKDNSNNNNNNNNSLPIVTTNERENSLEANAIENIKTLDSESESEKTHVTETTKEQILDNEQSVTMPTISTTNATTKEPLINLLDDITTTSNPTTTKTTTTTITPSTTTRINNLKDVYKVFTTTPSEISATDINTQISTLTPITTTPPMIKLKELLSITTTTTIAPVLKAAIDVTGSGDNNIPSSNDLDSSNVPSNTAEPHETDVNVIVAITVSVIGIVALILLVAFLYLIRKRQKQMSYGQRCRPVSLDAYSLDNVSVLGSVRRKGMMRASKRSYGNIAFDDPSLRHNILNGSELGKFLERRSSIFEEFRDIPQIIARADEVPMGCEDKNRYANVVPLPETRVMLQQQNDDEKSEYINANYVRGPRDARDYYIATQAPLEITVTDFWRMIWEQQSRVIIQATDLIENGIDKCAEYLPPSVTLDNHMSFGDFQVTLKHREIKDKYAISTILLKNTIEDTSRELYHYWYKWPETGVPNEEAPLIAMLLEVRSSLKSFALEQANELKEKSSTLTLKSTDTHNSNSYNSNEDDDVVMSSSNEQNTKQQQKPNETKSHENTFTNNDNNSDNAATEKLKLANINTQGPLTVHCSPGTGRTGTIIACDMAIRSLETKRNVDVPQIVYYVRRGRASAVQTKEQYEFIYKVANIYATKITNTVNES